MARIGTFWKVDDGYRGTITTLTMKLDVHIVQRPAQQNEKAPAYTVYADRIDKIELGVAWIERKDGREYLSVLLDDPSFTAPIQALLVKADEDENSTVFTLIWQRR